MRSVVKKLSVELSSEPGRGYRNADSSFSVAYVHRVGKIWHEMQRSREQKLKQISDVVLRRRVVTSLIRTDKTCSRSMLEPRSTETANWAKKLQLNYDETQTYAAINFLRA